MTCRSFESRRLRRLYAAAKRAAMKPPREDAMGHRFGALLVCDYCGVPLYAQLRAPAKCRGKQSAQLDLTSPENRDARDASAKPEPEK